MQLLCYQLCWMELGLLTVLLFALPSAGCPYTECVCSGDVISCHSKTLEKIPALVPTTNTYKTLKIFNNRITSIPDNSLPANLVEIDFRGNPIATIAPSAFKDSASTLQVLTFSNAKLTSLPQALRILTNLRSLELTNIPIQGWTVDILQDIGQTLQSLVLNNVGLTSWPNWFSYLPHLTSVRFSRDPITTVPDTALDQVKQNLQKFAMTTTNLSSIPVAVASLNALTDLDLNDNSIQNLDNLPRGANLTALYLGKNQISDSSRLAQEVNYYSDSLTYLYMDGNKLTAIPDLSNMKSLHTVNLRDNLIADTLSGSLSDSVYVLELTDNKLPAIPAAVQNAKGLTRLVIRNNSIVELKSQDIPQRLTLLDVTSNAIVKLTDTSFPANSNLQTLTLSGNPISSVSPNAFKELPRLTQLQFQDTKITRVPLALAALNSLTLLDLRHNPSLVCTCQEASLITWFQSQPGLRAFGQCGELTIKEFYQNVASGCPGQR